LVAIDTNVFAVAEGLHDGASDQCVAACIRILLQIDAGHPLVVDDLDLILSEYLGALRGSGTSGIASKLAEVLWRTRHGGERCDRVTITPIDDPDGSFAEVPELLRDFDLDDQKFIAVAVAANCAVVAGIDGEWSTRQADFARSGVDVQYACLADLLNQ
jgi:hypothetical protein